MTLPFSGHSAPALGRFGPKSGWIHCVQRVDPTGQSKGDIHNRIPAFMMAAAVQGVQRWSQQRSSLRLLERQ